MPVPGGAGDANWHSGRSGAQAAVRLAPSPRTKQALRGCSQELGTYPACTARPPARPPARPLQAHLVYHRLPAVEAPRVGVPGHLILCPCGPHRSQRNIILPSRGVDCLGTSGACHARYRPQPPAASHKAPGAGARASWVAWLCLGGIRMLAGSTRKVRLRGLPVMPTPLPMRPAALAEEIPADTSEEFSRVRRGNPCRQNSAGSAGRPGAAPAAPESTLQS